MASLPAGRAPNVLVGYDTWDDAGVYQLREDLAIVNTVDFFTPIVDDPRDFGAVAAANALSDVYAMGGEPLTAMGIVCFPHAELPLRVLGEAMGGAQTVLEEAGVALVGGHSVKDPEFKFGLAVTGQVHPARVVANRGAQVGNLLVLTKPLGTGILATAVKRDLLDAATTRTMVESMRRLNRGAAHAMIAAGARAATDITGYGLAGHAASMASASGVTIEVDGDALPLLPRALELLRDGVFPGGLRDNLAALEGRVEYEAEAHPDWRLAFDPQTSGGLCVALAAEGLEVFQRVMGEHGEPAGTVIGRVVEPGARAVVFT